MTFAETFVQVVKWFGILVWAVVTLILIGGPIIALFDDADWKYPGQSFIIGIVSALLLATFAIYKAQPNI